MRFVLEEDYKYEVGQEVSVFQSYPNNEVIGTAKVCSIKPTTVTQLDGTRVSHNEVTFEFNDSLKQKSTKYTPYFKGMTGQLCVVDEELKAKEKKKQHQRNVDNVRKLSLDFKYVCLSCTSVIASSKEFKTTSCKHCRKGKLEKVNNW